MNTQKAIDLTYELENLLKNIRELDSLDGSIQLTPKAKHEDYAAEIQAVKDTLADEVEHVMRELNDTIDGEEDLDDLDENSLTAKAQRAINYLGAKRNMDTISRQLEEDGLPNLFSGKINSLQGFLDSKINVCMIEVKELVRNLKS